MKVLNLKQRIAIGAGVLILLLMCLLPPWNYVYNYSDSRHQIHAVRSAGYYSVISPPEPGDPALLVQMFGINTRFVDADLAYFSTELDGKRLLVQGLMIGFLTTGCSLILSKRRHES